VLFTAFLQQFCMRNQRPPLSVTAPVLTALSEYDWPGNVRELRNVAERLSVFGSDPITLDQLPSLHGVVRAAPDGPVLPLREFRAQTEREYIESVLRKTNWNVSKAAQLLEIQRTYLHEKMSTLGIRKGR
jgi:DNA-binding NtrC family response regulator